ncbi:FAD-dependent oxidoreductase [Streptomyces sp. NPDC090056]|uniref:FAD-dependent oxidoreductase n=1 Tax=Streptomyces sp. NPDC090056 TaxID=3365934 RepID=UPI0038184CB0
MNRTKHRRTGRGAGRSACGADERVVVVGNGIAAHRLTERLAALGHGGPVTVLGAEPHPAYQRTLLGSVLDGSLAPEAVTLPEPPRGTRVLPGVRITRIDRARRLVHGRTSAGESVAEPYGTLVLATGARPVAPGRGFHSLDDSLRPVHGRVAVVGGGVLGVETATALRRRGHQVVLAHAGPYPMHRHLDATAGALVVAALEDWGVELRLDKRVEEDEILDVDTVVWCVGSVPETSLALGAGLRVRHGVVVDGRLRTSDPAVRAIGACTGAPGLVGALGQAETLAADLTGGPAWYTAPSPILRPRVPGLDVACLGFPGFPVERTVTLHDPALGRYARLELVRDRIARAVLVGLPEGIAAVSQLYDREAPLPADPLGLLLGTAGAAPDESVVCHCNGVDREAVERAWHDGARSVGAVVEATRATTGCGGCSDTLRAVCAALGPAREAR